jgi:hypothetical protein
MLVDIVVRNHEVVAAKPTKVVAPIVLVRTEVGKGDMLPVIKWTGLASRPESYGNSGLEVRNRVFGRLKGAALRKPRE